VYLRFGQPGEAIKAYTDLNGRWFGGSQIVAHYIPEKDYVKKFCLHNMTNEIKNQIMAFVHGFRLIIPLKMISMFSISELQLMISGLESVDFSDMKEYCKYEGGYCKTSDIIKWLWEILEELEDYQKSSFLFFLSGSVKIPYGGFKNVDCSIKKATLGTDSLPLAHTCFYELELPEYESKEKLKEKLFMAMFEGSTGFYIR